MKDHIIFDYNKITPSIYLGTNACCEWHFSRELLKNGVSADISLEGERIDYPKGAAYYVWLPTRDHQAPTLKQLKMGIACIDVLIKEKVKIYIHCKNGHGRAPTLLAGYFISEGMGVDEAIRFIKKYRKEIHIEPPQKKLLMRYDRIIRKK